MYRKPRKSLAKKTMTSMAILEHDKEDKVVLHGMKGYLKYLYVAQEDICEKYKIDKKDLHILLFVNDLKYFTARYVSDIFGLRETSVRVINLLKMVNLGLIEVFLYSGMLSPVDVQRFGLESGNSFKKRYRITQLGRLCVKKFYNKVEGKDSIYVDEKK